MKLLKKRPAFYSKDESEEKASTQEKEEQVDDQEDFELERLRLEALNAKRVKLQEQTAIKSINNFNSFKIT